jgi:TorA maturation chaperone TorD
MGECPLADLDPAQIFARLPASADELNDLYEANFGLLGGSKCPPYQTEFVHSKFTFQRSNMLADVAGFYNAFGLQTSSTHPDRPDHIVLECEFAAQLLRLAIDASASGSSNGTCDTCHSNEQVEVCLAALERFLSEHVVWWFPAFAKLLAHQDSDGFYAAVARFLAAFVAAERALAGIEPPGQTPQPSPIENPDECSGCLVTIE